jgi:MFS family permease
MMFLNFFIWGIWFVTLGTYLIKGKIGADDVQTGLAFGTQCLGAIIAPFIIGLIADKYFAAQKILGVLHLMVGAFVFPCGNGQLFSVLYTPHNIYGSVYADIGAM